MYKKFVVLIIAFVCAGHIVAQDLDLSKMLEEESSKEDKMRTNYTSATFKSTRLINGHSVETLGKGILDFRISHRFDKFSDGFYEMFGLDHAKMRIGLDYGLTDRFMFGLGRSTYEKQYDGFVKYKILRQTSGFKKMPVTVDVMASVMRRKDTAAIISELITNHALSVKDIPWSRKMYYCFQVIIARKFNESTSLQIMPTLIHNNIVKKASDPNNNIAIGIGGRQKISKRVSINGEYYYVLPAYKFEGTTNSLSFGVDIETGGHVFQLHLTNSTGMTERSFIAKTQKEGSQWSKGDINFGFNISRVFVIGKKKTQSKYKIAEGH
ncbi:DUF5777 family beta-barrel protein [Segetibacter koreensis]|uniref:DUF5777 family beta-barrel protein n=1 Tax=Segetibacter koreensis TaxID=398037 RepID=UPI00037D3516|nr:DUF5777 family beta-barrel protein [Segetibacter koreensis]